MPLSSADIYEKVTGSFIEALKEGNLPWETDWSTEGFLPRSAATKKLYTGINPFLLSIEAQKKGYKSPWWITYKQAAKKGGNVKKGEKSTMVTFWKMLYLDKNGKALKFYDADKVDQTIPFLRHYNVFNLDQCENVEAPKVDADNLSPVERAEGAIKSFPNPPEVRNTVEKGDYDPGEDVVYLPKNDHSPEFYGDAFHQYVHATGHGERLCRISKDENNIPAHSKEELTALLGSSLLAGLTGIKVPEAAKAKGYIEGWISALEENTKLVVSAGSKAQAAAKYIVEGADEDE